MPGMSGPELHSELKRLNWKIPVIFITANRDEVLRRHMLEEGAIECLFKPIKGTELRKALTAALAVP